MSPKRRLQQWPMGQNKEQTIDTQEKVVSRTKEGLKCSYSPVQILIRLLPHDPVLRIRIGFRSRRTKDPKQ